MKNISVVLQKLQILLLSNDTLKLSATTEYPDLHIQVWYNSTGMNNASYILLFTLLDKTNLNKYGKYSLKLKLL